MLFEKCCKELRISTWPRFTPLDAELGLESFAFPLEVDSPANFYVPQ